MTTFNAQLADYYRWTYMYFTRGGPFLSKRHTVKKKPGGRGRTSYVLCRAVRDARLYMGYFWEILCTFPGRWVPFFNKISVFFLQGGYLIWRKFLYLSNKIEPICKKFSVFYSTKLVHFTRKISVYFYKI